MLLDLDFNLTNLDDTEIFDEATKNPVHVARFVAEHLFKSDLSDDLKVDTVARKLFKDGKIEIDDSTSVFIEEFINGKIKLDRARPELGEVFRFLPPIRAAVRKAIMKARAEAAQNEQKTTV